MAGAVFISYASQDAASAKRIAESLRSVGIEVWVDTEGGLEHGDQWDAKIRRQIRDCSLFLALISANTQARTEGYFRIEWELAADRAVGIASGFAFILPILIDDTREPDALVPDRFRKVQWTRSPGGELSPAAQNHFLKLWSSRTGTLAPKAISDSAPGAPAPFADRSRLPLYVGVAVAAALVAGASIWLTLRSHPSATPVPVIAGTAQPAPESEARRLAHQAAELSVSRYSSTQDDFQTAEGLIKKALELDPNDGEVLAISADLNFMFVNRGFDRSPERMATARSQSERALKLVPDSVEALFIHAVVQSRLSLNSSSKSAQAALRRVIAKSPDFARAKIYLGGLLAFDGQEAEALRLYDQAAQQREWAPLGYYFAFLDEFGFANFPDAERDVRKSIAANPSVNPNAALAQIQISWKGNLDDALRELSTIAPADQANQRIVWITTIIHLYRRRPSEALATLDLLPDDFIHDSWYTGPKDYLVGRAQAIAGRAVAAKIAWEHGLTLVDEHLKSAPTNAPLHLIRGELLGSLNRPTEAQAEAQAVDELASGKVQAWDRSVVRIYATMGRADLAVPILKQQLDRAGKFADGWPLTRTLLRLDPLWDKLRGDPAFQALLVEPMAPTQR